MKPFVFALVLLSSVILFSCVSNSLVPGSASVEIENLYKEYFSLAENYNELKKYDKAETYYLKASSLKELYWPCVYKLSEVYLKQSKWAEAEANYQKLIKRDGDNILLKECLAYAYASEGKFEEALKIYESFDKISQIEELSQYTLENYFIVLVTLEKYDLAKEKLALLQELFPDNANITKYSEKLDSVLNPSPVSSSSDSNSSSIDDLKTENPDEDISNSYEIESFSSTPDL